MRRFNVTGHCIPEEDYMVDISGKISQIKELIDDRCYFTINRARQYGKTTMLYALRRYLPDEYLAVKISFEGLDDGSFESPERFCFAFIRQIIKALRSPSVEVEQEYAEKWADDSITNFDLLSCHITQMCKGKKIVLMIDEVDKTSNNRVFIQFLNMLRDKFLARKSGDDYTFHSVILAGVYDVKNIKSKMINEGLYIPSETEDKIYNSPWNIAVNFNVDMSFNPAEIATMLKEYESDFNNNMDITVISEEIYSYTSGYPFLVSRICQCIDVELNKEWTVYGVQKAVKIILEEKNTLFDDLYKNLENNTNLYNLIYDILIMGKQRTYSVGNPTIDWGMMFGIIKKTEESIIISNKIFEIIICDYFISKNEDKQSSEVTNIFKDDIIKNGKFDMELCMKKFAEYYAELYSNRDLKFIERDGRFLFIMYI